MCQESPPAEDPEEARREAKRNARACLQPSEDQEGRGESKASLKLSGDQEVRRESKARWGKRRTQETISLEPELPAPLDRGRRLEAPGLQELPSCEALGSWLRKHGVEADEWKQQKGGKDIKDLWKEVKLQECGMELWETTSGEVKPVRVVHVLRAKVCSPESYERNIFCFNRWQQFSDGRTRTRNGLLSEKLSVAEMPLKDHLHEVCRRAVTTEEMQRVDDAAFRVGPGYGSPEYDKDYVCPISVADQRFVDHSVEIVKSASYPNLITLYHLYTVEIVCEGLPTVDFTTLEFHEADESGDRKLKYVHGWCWLEWSQIQRYLFEGSELKDRKVKGSFKDAVALTAWLSNFDLELSAWGTDDWKSTEDLYAQVESGEAHLEHWGRHDGVPLLMRVVHVARLEVKSSDVRLLGKLLLQTWQQEPGSSIRITNRLMTGVMNTLDLPFDEQRLKDVAAKTIQDKLGFLVDAHTRIASLTPAMMANLQHSGVQAVRANLIDHHISVDESPSYKGMCTLYHFYDMHVECQGLPLSDFASITLQHTTQPDKHRVRICQGFRWVTWPSCIDIWQAQVTANQRKQDALKKVCRGQQEALSSTSLVADSLGQSLARLAATMNTQDVEEAGDLAESLRLVRMLQDELESAEGFETADIDMEDITRVIPPSMVSVMSERTIVAKETLESAALRRMRLLEKLGSMSEDSVVEHAGSTSSGGTPQGVISSSEPSAQQQSIVSGSMENRLHQKLLEEAFATVDPGGSGTVYTHVLERVLRSIVPDVSTESIQMVLAAVNPSNGDTVRYKDFIRWLYEEHPGGRPSAAVP